MIWSCIPDQNNKTITDNPFYDINGLIDEQVKILDSISPSILKKAVLNGKEEFTELTPVDSGTWAKELIIFKSVDINRSMLSDSYMMNESFDSDNKKIIYTSKYSEKTKVEELSILLDTESQNPIEIHATVDDRNELFDSSKKLEIHFITKDDILLLTSYKIEGSQKMISKDSTIFLIEAEIVYP